MSARIPALVPLAFSIVCLAVSGCSKLQIASAGQVGCSPKDIQITDKVVGWDSSAWRATCQGKMYQCSSVATANAVDYSCAPVADQQPEPSSFEAEPARPEPNVLDEAAEAAAEAETEAEAEADVEAEAEAETEAEADTEGETDDDGKKDPSAPADDEPDDSESPGEPDDDAEGSED